MTNLAKYIFMLAGGNPVWDTEGGGEGGGRHSCPWAPDLGGAKFMPRFFFTHKCVCKYIV